MEAAEYGAVWVSLSSQSHAELDAIVKDAGLDLDAVKATMFLAGKDGSDTGAVAMGFMFALCLLQRVREAGAA